MPSVVSLTSSCPLETQGWFLPCSTLCPRALSLLCTGWGGPRSYQWCCRHSPAWTSSLKSQQCPAFPLQSMAALWLFPLAAWLAFPRLALWSGLCQWVAALELDQTEVSAQHCCIWPLTEGESSVEEPTPVLRKKEAGWGQTVQPAAVVAFPEDRIPGPHCLFSLSFLPGVISLVPFTNMHKWLRSVRAVFRP